MNFMSLIFFLFVIGTALIYFLAPDKVKWVVLLIASYIFFWSVSGMLLFVHIAAVVITFITGRTIAKVYEEGDRRVKEITKNNPDMSKEELKPLKKSQRKASEKKAKGVMILGVVLVLLILVLLKYHSLFGSLLELVGVNTPKLSLLLPIGISFYTLQAIGYMVDVYRKNHDADDNLFKFALFMSFFPQIVQGPFARYSKLAHQLYEPHHYDYDRVTKGAQLMIWGLIKKLVVADRMITAVITIFDNYQEYSGPMIFIGGAMACIQMYADFSGGIDIARGVAQILGIELDENFRQPFFATSVDVFWRRWHISLGAWMRDYIFYSLTLSKSFANITKKTQKVIGQNLAKKLPAVIAIFIVFLLVGIWHGSNLKYLAYGVWNGIFVSSGMLLDDFYKKTKTGLRINQETFSWRVFQIVRTFVIISLGELFSAAKDLPEAFKLFSMLPKRCWDFSFLMDGTLTKLGIDRAHSVVLVLFLVLMFVVDIAHEKGIPLRDSIARQNIVFRWMLYIGAIIAVLIFGIWGPGYDSAGFIYEQF